MGLIWFFLIQVLITGGPGNMVVLEVGPFASQAQCEAVQKTLTITAVKQADTYYGWTKSLCVAR